VTEAPEPRAVDALRTCHSTVRGLMKRRSDTEDSGLAIHFDKPS
jgi:hypothetical protein